MATLNKSKIDKQKKKKRKIFIFITIIEMMIAPIIIYIIHQMLSMLFQGQLNMDNLDVSYGAALHVLVQYRSCQIFFVFLQILYCALWIFSSLAVQQQIEEVDMIEVTDKIKIPVKAGDGQFGNQRFLTEEEKEEVYQICEISENKITNITDGGLVVHYKKMGSKEFIYYIGAGKHAIIFGTTGAGKTRRLLIETIFLQLLSGHCINASDVKGEIFYFTHKFAKSLGYNTLPFDLREPKKSIHYNFLQPIIKELKEGNKPEAIDATWDLVSVLVGKAKGEAIWTNGESATLAAAILIVANDAPEDYRNLTNVYFFISYMCKAREDGILPMAEYLKELDTKHPAFGVFAMADIAPFKTRASFFTSALGTLKLFANQNIAEMTSKSDFDLEDIAKSKTILYMMIPDEKKTYYPIVSLLVTQLYESNIKVAKNNGLVLPIPVDYDIDEAGNFPFIPILGTMVSAGRSRKIRGNLIFQDEQQLENVYKEDYRNIMTCCQVKVLLKSDDPKTTKTFSESFGPYTVEVSGASTGLNDGKQMSVNYGSSASLTRRSLLDVAEVQQIDKPYILCKEPGVYGAVNYLPDLSEYSINKRLGLGDESHNQKLIIQMEKERREHKVPELQLWGIWEKYKEPEPEVVPVPKTKKNNKEKELQFLK